MVSDHHPICPTTLFLLKVREGSEEGQTSDVIRHCQRGEIEYRIYFSYDRKKRLRDHLIPMIPSTVRQNSLLPIPIISLFGLLFSLLCDVPVVDPRCRHFQRL